MTGSREDLQLGGETTTSYGYIFNVRTKEGTPTVMMTGFDFYTESTDDVTFELWSRLGSFKDAKGTYDGWDLIATGTTRGRGVGRYTAIPEEMYTPVSIPGGGGDEGTRAFYLTLDTINLVYKYGERGMDSDSKWHVSTPDIEVWEGEGVLFYPFPDPSQAFFYRYPRQYLGAIYYDRLPCRPFSLYGPVDALDGGGRDGCPLVPTGSPTVPPPTRAPATDEPTRSPVEQPTGSPTVEPPEPTGSPIIGQTPEPINPTAFPTLTPTVSKAPTYRPTTVEPTRSPVEFKRANIITTLRNVPDREMTVRELEKYIDILTRFLRRHTESSMVIDGIDYWHAERFPMDAKEGTVAVASDGEEEEEEEEGAQQAPQVAARGAARRDLGWKKKEPEPIPQVTAVDVTLILRVTFANLPDNMLGSMAAVAIEENAQEFLALLKEQQAFYTFFKLADGVFCRVIDEVTGAPTGGPTTAAHYEAVLAAQLLEDMGAEEEEDAGLGFGECQLRRG